MTTFELMLVILFTGLVFGSIGLILIKVNHEFTIIRTNGLARFITTDVKRMLYDYTDDIMKKTIDMTMEMQKKMMEDSET